MAKSHKVLTSPASGTKISPVHLYSTEQTSQIEALQEVGQFNLSSCYSTRLESLSR